MDLWGFPDAITEALLRAKAAQHPGPPDLRTRRPRHLVEMSMAGLGMANCSRPVADEGLDERLQQGDVYCRHAGTHFNGEVWWEDGTFHEVVWVYGQPRQHITAETLEALAAAVNDTWGWE